MKKLLRRFRYLIYLLDCVVILIICLSCIKYIGIDTREILSGSMEPVLNVGDIVYIKDITLDKIEVGDIIAYKLDDTTIVHRVIKKTEEGLVTKGDAVSQADGIAVSANDLEGKVIFHLSNGITFYNFISSLEFKSIVVILIIFNLLL